MALKLFHSREELVDKIDHPAMILAALDAAGHSLSALKRDAKLINRGLMREELLRVDTRANLHAAAAISAIKTVKHENVRWLVGAVEALMQNYDENGRFDMLEIDCVDGAIFSTLEYHAAEMEGYEHVVE